MNNEIDTHNLQAFGSSFHYWYTKYSLLKNNFKNNKKIKNKAGIISSFLLLNFFLVPFEECSQSSRHPWMNCTMELGQSSWHYSYFLWIMIIVINIYLNLTNYLTSHTTPDCSMFLWTWWRSQLNTRDSWHPLCLGSLGVMILKYLESLKMILSEEKKQNRHKLKSLKVVIVKSLLRLKILSARNVVVIILFVLTFVTVSLHDSCATKIINR